MRVLPRLQTMTLGWPWPILRQGQIRLQRLLYGRKWKLLFGTYCSRRSQSCLKHSAKWVNEVEWVSKVKVILWPWSKVTLTYFMSRSNLVTKAFVWEKVKVIYCLELIAAVGLKVAWSIQLNELMKLSEYQRSRSFFDLGQRSLRFQS